MDTGPSRILAMIPRTDNFVAELRGRWGPLNVPPGTYEIMIVPTGDRAVPVRMGTIAVRQGERKDFVVGSGVRLVSENDLEPLDWWVVERLSGGDRVAQVARRWGVTPLPPGRYRMSALIPGDATPQASFEVKTGEVTEVMLADLGVGRVELEMPPRNAVTFMFGGDDLVPLLEMDGSTFDMSQSRSGNKISLWLPVGRIAVERRSGSFLDRYDVDVVAGQEHVFPFDLEEIASRKGLGLFRMPDALRNGADTLLNIAAARGDRALFSGKPSRQSRAYLIPGDAEVAVGKIGAQGSYRSISGHQVGDGAFVIGDASATDEPATLSMVVESPMDGAEFEQSTDHVRVVGQASATAEAGVTKLVVVLDVSASTAESSGADLDGDGAQDSVIAAELQAARDLFSAIAEVEEQSPGTQFAMGLVAFGDATQSLMGLQKLTEPGAALALDQALDQVVPGILGGSTFYDSGLDAALRMLEASTERGPALVLLITDGKPSNPTAAVDAAARLGVNDVVLHAIGLGTEFTGSVPKQISYPPLAERGPQVLAAMAQFGVAGSQVWALSRPADIVDLVPELPVLDRRDAEIASVRVRNSVTGQEVDARLNEDGTFEADVPVAFVPPAGRPLNRLTVLARAENGAEAETELRLFAGGMTDAERDRAAETRTRLSDALADLEAQLVQARAELAESVEREARLKEGLAAEQAAYAQTQGAALQTCTSEVAQCQANLTSALNELLRPTPVAQDLVLSFPGDVLFDFDDSALRDDAAEILRLASLFLLEHEKSDILIEGHTDTRGAEDYNLELSDARARSVASWLVENGKVSVERITAKGLGESRPVSAEVLDDGSDWPEGRQKNRRVEIRIAK